MIFSFPALAYGASILFFGSSGSHAFVTTSTNVVVRPSPSKNSHDSRLYASLDDDGGESSSSWDIESARLRLEGLLHGGEESSGLAADATSASSVVSQCEKSSGDFLDKLIRQSQTEKYLLTSIGRERRVAEIQLLSALGTVSDDDDECEYALEELQSLWSAERGQSPKRDLDKADKLFQQGLLPEAEERLIKLIEQQGVYFVEPLHRLSMIYYLQKDFPKARALAELVLKHKPYHAYGLSNLVRILDALHLRDDAIQWASKRFATSKHPNRRLLWARRSTQKAMDLLAYEERRVEEHFGPPDETPRRLSEDELAWQ